MQEQVFGFGIGQRHLLLYPFVVCNSHDNLGAILSNAIAARLF
jgi:hypothetical protein